MENSKAFPVIIAYLKACADRTIANHEMATELYDYGKLYHNIAIAPDTYSRKFRMLREKKEYLKSNGIEIIEFRVNESREKHFIVKLTEVEDETRNSDSGSTQPQPDN